MARQLRIHPPGGFHHVTARGNNKLPIFNDDEDRYGFLRVLASACKRSRTDLVAYCLMTNHVHLTLRDNEGKLSSTLRHAKGVYTQRFNQRHSRTGHLFEGRFWSSLLETDSYLSTAVEYVHRNPVAAGLVQRPEEYAWSSYQEYVGLRPRMDALEVGPVLSLYGNDVQKFRRSTERESRDSHKEDELDRRRPSPVLGSAAFKKRMAAEGQLSVDTESSRRRTREADCQVDIETIITVAAGIHGVQPEEVKSKLVGYVNEGRAAAIYLAHRQGWPLMRIASHFNLKSSSAVSMTSRRFQLLLDKEPDVRERLETVERRLAVNVKT